MITIGVEVFYFNLSPYQPDVALDVQKYPQALAHRAGVFRSTKDNDVMMAHDSAAALPLTATHQPRPGGKTLVSGDVQL